MGSKQDRKVKLRLLYERKGSSYVVDAETDNISPDGVFITTKRRPLAVGTKVSILMELQGKKKEFQIQGSVAWQGAGEPIDAKAGTSGMGIAFEDMEEEAREMLFAAIEEYESGDGRGPSV